MLKRFLLVICYLSVATFSMAGDYLHLSTNRAAFLVGEQVHFDVQKYDQDDLTLIDEQNYLVLVDLVAPSGKIVQSKSLVKTEAGKYFFALADTLKTGIYRLIANTEGANQIAKRIHIYSSEIEEVRSREISKLEYKVQGGNLIANRENKLAIRVADEYGAGLLMKGTIVDSRDSLVQYLDTDANGVAPLKLFANDSLYKIHFGAYSITLKAKVYPIFSELKVDASDLTLNISKATTASDQLTLRIDGEMIKEVALDSMQNAAEVKIQTSAVSYGIHNLSVDYSNGMSQKFVFMNSPKVGKIDVLDDLQLNKNEEGEFSIEDTEDQLAFMEVSVIDHQMLHSGVNDFYEDLFFNQLNADLQLVDQRDYEAYLLLFAHQLEAKSNRDRMSPEMVQGVLAYKNNFPYDEVSVLNLKTMNAVDMRCENLTGIHDFESRVTEKVQVFPYHFTTYLQPIKQADLTEKVDYNYPKLLSKPIIDEKVISFVNAMNLRMNIMKTYKSTGTEELSLPTADYTYDLDEFEIPNTMVDLINYIVKYVSVRKNDEGDPELSMYRYMSTYKYRGIPLIFLNNLPVYDLRTVLNLNPKDFASIEVRNSYQANGHLGNFSLNGSVSFFLKDNVDNPLEREYKNLLVLEPRENFNLAMTNNDHAPDFRHQLYWNAKLDKRKDKFWIDLKSSDLTTSYEVHIMAHRKDGSVATTTAALIVQ